MTDPNYPFFTYAADAWSYVERAQKQLQLFDAGNPEQPSPRHPILWWGINSTLFGKHLLDQHSEPRDA
jgi:hypothetical protein